MRVDWIKIGSMRRRKAKRVRCKQTIDFEKKRCILRTATNLRQEETLC